MRFLVLLGLFVGGCGDNVVIVPPDAPPFSCCDLWPDTDAILACLTPTTHACARAHCETPDGPVDYPVCGP